MEIIRRNGISGITAATLLAIRPISQSPLQNIETGNHDASGRSMSLCGLIDNEGNVGMSKIMESKNNSRKAENTVSSNLESQDRKASVSAQTEKESQQLTYDSLENMVCTLINIYATLLVCIYIAFSFTELVTFPSMYRWLDIHGFFIYLYTFSNTYLIYLLCYVMKCGDRYNNKMIPKVVENLEVGYKKLLNQHTQTLICLIYVR